MNTVRDYKFRTDNKLRVFGMTDLGKKVMYVNKKKNKKSKNRGELLDSIVHEHTHARHPKMHEQTVRKVTRAMLPTLSKKQKAAYYARFA